MSTTIRSGKIGVPPLQHNFLATPETFEAEFSHDLMGICLLFKSTLGINIAYPSIVLTPSDPNFIMIELAGGNAERGQQNRDVTFNVFIERPISDQDSDKSASAAHTANRLQWLLADNSSFNGACGIVSLKSFSLLAGVNYLSPVNTEGDEQFSDGALLAVTYEIVNSLLNSDR